MNKFSSTAGLLALATVLSATIVADEGMFPLSEIARLNLKAKGLKIDVKEIYNPEGVSLIQAICEVGGGTGEFVSKDGLILTNHHIAFAAVAAASTPEHDYLTNGFTAATREKEIPAKDYTCSITESYKDVSAEVLAGLADDMTPADRSRAIRAKMSEIAKTDEAGRKDITCEVSEMFPGRSYILFRYRTIRDVRLVYVPPRSIGEYGGENDNWIWPRHTGDFSFMRAYVAADGSPTTYSKDNIPFTPQRFLTVATRGTRDGDFVMILGYPGRTFRHKTSDFLALQQDIQLPYMSGRFDWMINTMENASEGDPALKLMFATSIKSYANATKNYKGKMQGLRRLELVEKKRTEEQELQAFIDKNSERKKAYGTLLADIRGVYNRYRTVIRQEMIAAMMNRTHIMTMASALLAAAEGDHTPESLAAIKNLLEKHYNGMFLPVETAFLARSLAEISSLPAEQRFLPSFALPPVEDGRKAERAIREHLEAAFPRSIFASREALLAATGISRAELVAKRDPVLSIAIDLRKEMDLIRERQRIRDGELLRLEGDLLDVKMQWRKRTFLPDANSTLRFTYGYIRGYSPADATRFLPLTTLRGIIEKNTGEEPYSAPRKLVDLSRSKAYSAFFVDDVLRDVPVAMLYNLDTTGGNSGSPVMNAWGELVGVNFDRTFEATINDYNWSEEYSRSIAVDMRYVLFIAKYLGNADFLLRELGVTT